jgi:NAD(P)-dependent dehydrogenase (short-subunit alcohol dehydrogenase family)
MDKFRLDGRTALVTGAGRGIGRACALALAQAGAEVWLSARTQAEIDQAADEIKAAGGKARTMACDVTKSHDVRNLIASIRRLDVLVNNAGTNIPEPFVEVSEPHLDELITLNIRAAFMVAQVGARRMLQDAERKARGGAILNMSSQMGHVGALNRSVYCMTKHAIEGLTKAMALELAPAGIRVVSIAPTFVDTPMVRKMMNANPAMEKWVTDRIPQGRTGSAEQVADAVVFAASPAASLMTGTSLVVDGGWTAQ